MIKSRKDATDNGDKTYNTGKPCNKGHLSDRYTSGGMCIACIQERARDFKMKRNTNMVKRLSGHFEYTRIIKREHVALYTNLAVLLEGDDYATIDTLISIVTNMAGAEAAITVYAPEMKRADALRYFRFGRDGNVSNINDFDVLDYIDSEANTDVSLIYMNAHWYHVSDILQLLKIDSLLIAHPFTPPARFLPKVMKGIIP